MIVLIVRIVPIIVGDSFGDEIDDLICGDDKKDVDECKDNGDDDVDHCGDDEKDVDECKDNGDDDVDHCSENTNSNAMLMRMTFPTIVIVPLVVGGGGDRNS